MHTHKKKHMMYSNIVNSLFQFSCVKKMNTDYLDHDHDGIISSLRWTGNIYDIFINLEGRNIWFLGSSHQQETL